MCMELQLPLYHVQRQLNSDVPENSLERLKANAILLPLFLPQNISMEDPS